MLSVTLFCVGKMKEKHYIAAAEEYIKRLGGFCRFEIFELPENRLPENPSDKEIFAALQKEGAEILKRIPASAAVAAMCVEGREMPSEELSKTLEAFAGAGKSRVVFIIGGSFGLCDEVKKRADLRLSMSRMTFPHHLARVMVLEQIYRAFTISEGTKYHK